MEVVTSSSGWYDVGLYLNPAMAPLCTDYPFFMGLNKNIVISIGGYDEEFVGYAYDDTDFARRLKQYGLKVIKLPSKVVHLFHIRTRPGIPDLNSKLAYNRHLYDTRNNIIRRNIDKDWGKLDCSI